MRLTRRASLLAAVAVAALSTSAYAADPIKIGVSGPFTGGSSSMGVSMRDGVKLAIDEINKAGGVLGRPLQAVERDDEARNEFGVQIAQELINKEKVVADLGFINTGVALASQRFYQEAEIPVINNVATGSVITQAVARRRKERANYIFRTAANGQHPGADDRRRGDHPARLQEARDPRRQHQLRPARPRGPRESAWRKGREAGRRREVQHQATPT